MLRIFLVCGDDPQGEISPREAVGADSPIGCDEKEIRHIKKRESVVMGIPVSPFKAKSPQERAAIFGLTSISQMLLFFYVAEFLFLS